VRRRWWRMHGPRRDQRAGCDHGSLRPAGPRSRWREPCDACLQEGWPRRAEVGSYPRRNARESPRPGRVASRYRSRPGEGCREPPPPVGERIGGRWRRNSGRALTGAWSSGTGSFRLLTIPRQRPTWSCCLADHAVRRQSRAKAASCVTAGSASGQKRSLSARRRTAAVVQKPKYSEHQFQTECRQSVCKLTWQPSPKPVIQG